MALALLIPLLVALLVTLAGTSAGLRPAPWGMPGTVDYASYFTARQAADAGLDPYAPADLGPFQLRLGMTMPDEQVLVMWNPPWALLVMAPTMVGSYGAGVIGWLMANVAFAVAAAALATAAARREGEEPPVVPIAFAVTFFVPALQTLQFGQTNLFVGLAAAGAWLALVRGRDALAGACLALMTIKPHLAFLAWIVGGLWVVTKGRWGVVKGFLGALAVLVVVTGALWPSALAGWPRSYVAVQASADAAAVTDMQTASVPSVLRLWLSEPGKAPPSWPLWLIPGLAALGVVAWAARRRFEVDWSRHLPPLMALSLIVSPYAWCHDASAALLVQVDTVARAWRTKRWGVLAAVLGASLLTMVGSRTFLHAQTDYVFVAPVMLALWLAAARPEAPATAS